MNSYTKEEMLALWKKTRLLEPLRDDCIAEPCYGIDIDEYCTLQMRQWYLKLLAEGPLTYVPVTKMTPGRITLRHATLSGTSTLPADALRVLWVCVEGWNHGVCPTPLDQASPRLLASLAHPFMRPGPDNPVALLMPDRTLQLYPVVGERSGAFEQVPLITSLIGVADTGPDLYTFDLRALECLE